MQLNIFKLKTNPTASAVGTTYLANGNVNGTTPVTETCPSNVLYSAGNRLKDFRKRKASGELLPFTAYEKYLLTYQPGGRSYSWRRNDGVSYNVAGDLRYGGNAQVRQWDKDSILRVVNTQLSGINTKMLVQKAAADCYMQGYDLLTAAGEAGKTLAMIASVKSRLKETLAAEAKDVRQMKKTILDLKVQLKRLMSEKERRYAEKRDRQSDVYNALADRSIRNLKKDIRNLGQRVDRIASGYLEARYGWRTLWYDMQSLTKTLTTFDSKKTVYTNHAQKVQDKDYSFEGTLSGAAGTWTKTTSLTIYRSTRATVSAEYRASKFIQNFAVTGWELVTLSVVVDWFINIGDAIKAASLVALSAKTSCCVSTYTLVEIQISEHKPKLNSGYSSFNTNCNSSISFEHRTRTPVGISYVPGFQKKLDPYKIADLAAIGWGLARGRLRSFNKLNG